MKEAIFHISARKRPQIFGFITFMVLLIAGGYATFLNYRVAKDNQKHEMLYKLQAIENNMEQAFKYGYAAALIMSMTIDEQGVPQNFDSVAAKVMESSNILDAVELVPGGVIEYVYPLEGNEPVIGYDILADSTRKIEAYQAIESNKMFYAGPLELKQGGVAVVGRLPVFIQNEFWGFSAVIIGLDRLIQFSGLSDLAQEEYALQLSKVEPNSGNEEFFLPENEDFSLESAYSMVFPEGNWTLYINPKNRHTIFLAVIPLALACLITSIVGANLVYGLVNRPLVLEKKLAERSIELVRSERKFRSFFEQAAIGVAHIDSQTGKFLEANDRYCKLVGYDQEELLNKTYLDISHEDDIDASHQNVKRLIKGELTEYSMEKRYTQKNGKPVWVNLTVSPLWSPGEEPTTYLSIAEDITERKNFQQLLLESSLQAQETEKNRIASELHDGIVQEMVGCGIQCENLIDMTPEGSELAGRLRQLYQLIKKTTNETRSLSHNLLSGDMEHMSFAELLDRLQHQLKSSSSIDIRIDNFLDDRAIFPKETKINLYRAIQELSTNILKHSQATFAVISIEKIGREIFVTVRDNGVGLKPTDNTEGIGAYNVKSRIYKIGGSIEYRKPESGGLQVSISVPLG